MQGAWIPAFLDEAEVFPHGEHDDQIDALSGAIAMLTAETQKSRVPSRSRHRGWSQNARWAGEQALDRACSMEFEHIRKRPVRASIG